MVAKWWYFFRVEGLVYLAYGFASLSHATTIYYSHLVSQWNGNYVYSDCSVKNWTVPALPTYLIHIFKETDKNRHTEIKIKLGVLVIFRSVRIVMKSAYWLCHVRPSAWISVDPTGRSPWNLVLGTFMETRQEIPSLVKIRQKYRTFYVKTPVVYSLLLLATLNRRKSALFELNGIRMSGGRQGTNITRTS
jgi:hypothetical protein